LVFIDDFNPDYAIAFVMSGVIERKSGYLEIEAAPLWWNRK